jgi:hypothetical protein
MLILEDSLKKGNNAIKTTLKATKHDKAKTYDKIISMILDNCYNEIEQDTAYQVYNILFSR